MSLNGEFNDNPIRFIMNRVILVPNNVTPGDNRFKLVANTDHSCLLNNASSPPSQDDLRGYYVKPLPDNINQYHLVNTVDYMFTDVLNGCQFLAYGDDRQNVTVEHNNFFSDPSQYQERALEISSQGFNYLFMFRPNIDYNTQYGACIIGTYDISNGWRFWVRQRVDQDKGPVVGPC